MVKNYVNARFREIERKQDELRAELKAIILQASVFSTESASLSMIQEIGRLRRDLVIVKDRVGQHSDLLDLYMLSSPSGDLAESEFSSLSFVTISDRKWQNVDVHAEKNSSSKIIGQASYGTSYQYMKKENGYYQINLGNGFFGWIHSQFVKEI